MNEAPFVGAATVADRASDCVAPAALDAVAADDAPGAADAAGSSDGKTVADTSTLVVGEDHVAEMMSMLVALG